MSERITNDEAKDLIHLLTGAGPLPSVWADVLLDLLDARRELESAHAHIRALTSAGVDVLHLYAAQPTDDLQVVASVVDRALRWTPEQSATVDALLERENLYAHKEPR